MTSDLDLPDDLFLFHPGDAEDARRTLSFRRTPTVLLTFAANRFTRLASREYQARFGIGAMDWRMLVMLAREPGTGVNHAARTIGIDKAAVSRSLRRLADLGLARLDDGSTAARGAWRLTGQGAALHDRILDVALDRQSKLLDGFTRAEVSAFADYLRRFLGNLDDMAADGTTQTNATQRSD
ncbi:MarR family winged helix-turn-helix transcriptional regulator [Chachezhania sediminis]|uniref:MarR family winged helix-turn-helix transcriptional regulator n=1 Tax=Chachezhania sediminis TaxID=2599291 RepID=UPI00131BF99B|nr:MarR family winged helix-turn-helix transcriptional regulator [Chachezhania sediminis]